jgi:hypothetical protein
VGLPWYVLRGRSRGVRRPVAARLWLLCASGLVGLAGVELGAAAWLAWSHRMPALPTRLPAAPKGEATVAVIGESSAKGYPYHPWLSVGQIVAWELGRAMPGLKVRADILARVGSNMEEMHQELATLSRRPDVLIIFCGHNEFLTRFDSARDAALHEAPVAPALERLYRVSLRSPLCRLVYETVSKNRLGGPPPPLHKHHLIDPPAVTPSEYAAVLSDFHRRLESIVGYCERVGCVPVLVIPPGNEGGFEPNRSVLEATATPAERRRVEREFAAARAAEGPEPRRALAGYEAILGRHPGFAEAQFRAGRVLEGLGEYASASRRYEAARDADAFPVRCPGAFHEAYRSVARRHGCILVDGPAVLRGICPRGILDDHALNDAHHPALVGHAKLAEAVLGELRSRGVLGWRSGAAPEVGAAAVAEHFGMDAERWKGACQISASSYRGYALIRYDQTERAFKSNRLMDAARRIAEGVSPDETGVPGIGVRLAPPERAVAGPRGSRRGEETAGLR